MASAGAAGVIRFGAFEFNPSSGELRKGRTRLRVPDQSLAILAMLLERPGELVTRESIQARLWPNGTVVEFENSVNSAVKRLREALLDTAATPRYVETIPRRGYRFVGVLAPEEGGRAELTPGTVISHYRILGEAGRGAMGVVYKAEDTTLGRMVALKFLPEELAAHQPALERLRREARMIGALNHPGICTVHELGEASGRVFLAMEFLEGESLRERMARGAVSRAEFLDAAAQMARALEAAHGQGMIHRDIKPDNLFLTKQGPVKLMDFGLAKPIEEGSGAAEQSSVTGTSGYMSPEQKRGEPLDARSDIYSLGRVLKELAGEPPPARVAPILDRALAADPAERWKNAGELRAALERVQRRRRPRKVPVWLAAGGSALAVVLATGLWPIDVPKVERVMPLTSDTTLKGGPIYCDGRRVLFSAEGGVWSVPVEGGAPKRLLMPFVRPDEWVSIEGYSTLRRQMLVSTADGLWLAGDEGEAPHVVYKEKEGEYGVALAPDAERLAVAAPDGIYIQSVASGERKKVHPARGWTQVWWHPSGRKLAFMLANKPGKPGGKSMAWQVDDDGTHPRLVAPEEQLNDWFGAWSLDGQRYFASHENEIFVRVEAGILGWLRKAVVSGLTSSGHLEGQPAIDPVNPRRLYAVGTVRRGETMRYDRKAQRWVPFLGGFSGEMIERSPDGRSLVYIPFPGYELHKCAIDGSGDIVLTPGVHAENPKWSPDGKRIAFAGGPGDPGLNQESKLWLVSSSGGDAAPYRPEIASDARWSPDGKRLLIHSDPNGAPPRERVTILDLETGKVEPVPGSEKLWSPRWSPDGKRIMALTPDLLPYLFDAEKRVWRPLGKQAIAYNEWSRDGKYIYGMYWAKDRRKIVAYRINADTGRSEEVVRSYFNTIDNFGFWVGWTWDEDPLTIRDLSSSQIYRIDLDR